MSPRSINVAFIAILCSLPLSQAAWEVSRGEGIQALEVLGPIEGSRLRAFEEDLRLASFVHRELSPWYQLFLLEVFEHGNAKSILGRHDVLHYGPDLDYLSGPPILSRSRAALDCILDFRDQLAARGVELLLMPIPPKTCAQAAQVSSATSSQGWLDNAGAERFYAELDEAGVDVLRVDQLARDSGMGPFFFLERDTHWSPSGLSHVAQALVERIAPRIGATPIPAPPYTGVEAQGDGDLVGMLNLPPQAHSFEPMTVGPASIPAQWGEFELNSPLLLIGDSFTRVYSDPELGLGAGAGLGEWLAYQLQQSIDRIALAGGGALAVREALARRGGLSADLGGLEGKRVVIWQFSMRDLAAGPESWALVDLEPGSAASQTSPSNDGSGSPLIVRARLVEKSAVKSDFDYAFGLGIFEYEVLDVLNGASTESSLWVAHPIVRDREATDDAKLTIGTTVQLELDDISSHHNLEQTSWVDETDAPRRARFWFPLEYEVLD